jgi:hypothetical protein
MLRTTFSRSAQRYLYRILTGEEPSGELESAEVEARFSAAKFPDTSTLPFDEAMQSCWRGRASIQEVCSSIDTSIREMQKPDGPISETTATSLHDLPGAKYEEMLMVELYRRTGRLT